MADYNLSVTASALNTAITKAANAAPQSTTYTKTEVNTALAGKLNTSDVDSALSTTSVHPVQNKVVTENIARIIDTGAKNLIDVADTSTAAAERYIIQTLPVTLPAGDYVFVFNASAVHEYVIGLYDQNEQVLFRSTEETVSGKNVVEITIQNTASILSVFRTDGDGTVNYSDFMLCTAEDYAVSQSVVPYAPTNRELYEMILAMQN